MSNLHRFMFQIHITLNDRPTKQAANQGINYAY
jgi:hypothetical protein